MPGKSPSATGPAAGRLVGLEPLAGDPEPSAIGQGMVEAVHHRSRVRQPMVRKGWLDNGPVANGGGRGEDTFVPVEWDQALDLILRINNLDYVLENNVLRVAPVSKLTAEKSEAASFADQEEQAQPLKSSIEPNKQKMKDPIHQDELNRILLKPRFKLRYTDKKEDIIAQFRKNLADDSCRFPGKVVDHHIVIDVPGEEESFWSPQLHVEIEEDDRRPGRVGVAENLQGLLAVAGDVDVKRLRRDLERAGAARRAGERAGADLANARSRDRKSVV